MTRFPLFEWSEEEKRWTAMHHHFTSPVLEELDFIETDPARASARAYDCVLNGNEVGGGSIRIVLRSEERRVGKECRSRWSPYH